MNAKKCTMSRCYFLNKIYKNTNMGIITECILFHMATFNILSGRSCTVESKEPPANSFNKKVNINVD